MLHVKIGVLILYDKLYTDEKKHIIVKPLHLSFHTESKNLK